MNKLDIEFEAVFEKINKDEIRKKLNNIGAELIIPENIQTRKAFKLPQNKDDGFIRVRKEINGKTTMTIKIFTNKKISGQKEVEITVDDFDKSVNILQTLGLKQKAFQETKRELWKVDDVEIMIDEWPFLEPFIEIEGKNENAVKEISRKLGFDYHKAIFGPVTILYAKKYNISENQINNETPQIVFDMENPFICQKK